MGREVRRVPPDWQHPTYADLDEPYSRGDPAEHYHPLHDDDYDSACAKWLADATAWAAGTHPRQSEPTFGYPLPRWYQDWAGGPPSEEDAHYWRKRAWTADEATAYQAYENVTEGTPVSPVFPTREAMVAWLVSDYDMAPEAAEQFASGGYAPSFVVTVAADGSPNIQRGIDVHP
jgi:hypothetical protein